MTDQTAKSFVMKVDKPLTFEANEQAYGRLFWWAVGIFLASRLALLFIEVSPTSDSAWYFDRALELLKTGRYAENGISTAYWPVGYPGFLAGVLYLFGPTVIAGKVANLILSLVTLILLYRYCLSNFPRSSVANLSVLIYAVYPNNMGYSVSLNTEPLFTALLLGSIVIVESKLTLLRFVFVGVLLGLATLVKAQTLLLGPVLVFLLALDKWPVKSIRTVAERTGIGIIVMLAVISPWTVRNQNILGAPVPISTNGGMSLLAGNNPSMTTRLDQDYNDTDPIFGLANFSVKDQVAADKRAREAAFEWIVTHPDKFAALMPKKIFRLWVPDGESEWNFQAGFKNYEQWRLWFRSIRVVNQVIYLAVLCGMVYGIFLHVTFNVPRSLVTPMLLLFFTALSMVFSGQSRYHAPLMPFVIAFASSAIIQILSKRKPET